MHNDFLNEVTRRKGLIIREEPVALESFDEPCIQVRSIELVLDVALQSAGIVTDQSSTCIGGSLSWPDPMLTDHMEITSISDLPLAFDCSCDRQIIEGSDSMTDPDIEYPPEMLWGTE